MGQIFVFAVTMGYAGSADIFQAEMMDLMEALEYVRAYIDDLLVVTKGTLGDCLEKLGEGGPQEAAQGRVESQRC